MLCTRRVFGFEPRGISLSQIQPCGPIEIMPLTHLALFYDGDAEYAETLSSFVRQGLDDGARVLVSVPERRHALLREALDGQADAVAIEDMCRVGRNPSRIIPAVESFVSAAPGSVRFVGEPTWLGCSAEELVEGTRHEALLNLAFAGRDMAILCPYDVDGLPDSVLDDAGRTPPAPARPGRRFLEPFVRRSARRLVRRRQAARRAGRPDRRAPVRRPRRLPARAARLRVPAAARPRADGGPRRRRVRGGDERRPARRERCRVYLARLCRARVRDLERRDDRRPARRSEDAAAEGPARPGPVAGQPAVRPRRGPLGPRRDGAEAAHGARIGFGGADPGRRPRGVRAAAGRPGGRPRRAARRARCSSGCARAGSATPTCTPRPAPTRPATRRRCSATRARASSSASARTSRSVAPGDHVVTLFSPQCRECVHCLQRPDEPLPRDPRAAEQGLPPRRDDAARPRRRADPALHGHVDVRGVHRDAGDRAREGQPGGAARARVPVRVRALDRPRRGDEHGEGRGRARRASSSARAWSASARSPAAGCRAPSGSSASTSRPSGSSSRAAQGATDTLVGGPGRRRRRSSR